ncbi:MAG: hypothetical protein PHS27_00680 [Candidatus Pacebacteria bacterium]|nr:hypothetical protein [Candidatus Paceibacterota bacterium]
MISTEILEATPQAITTQFFIALCCALAILFLRKIPKEECPHRTSLTIFWLGGYGFYLFTALGWGAVMLFNATGFVEKLAIPQYTCVILQSVATGYYIVSLVTRSKFMKWIVLSAFGLVAVFFTIMLLTGSSFQQRDDIPFLTLPTALPEGTVIFIFISLMITLSLIIFRKDLRDGKFSFYHPETFYEFYTVMIYGSLVGIRILYFLPRPSFLDIFFVLIPILLYLRVKPYLIKKT